MSGELAMALSAFGLLCTFLGSVWFVVNLGLLSIWIARKVLHHNEKTPQQRGASPK